MPVCRLNAVKKPHISILSTINPRISSFFAAIFFRSPRKCSPGGLSKPLRDVRRRPSEAPPPLMRFLAPISTAISTAMPSSTPFSQTGPSSAWRPSRHLATNSLPVRLYSHGRSGRKGRVLPGREHAEPEVLNTYKKCTAEAMHFKFSNLRGDYFAVVRRTPHVWVTLCLPFLP